MGSGGASYIFGAFLYGIRSFVIGKVIPKRGQKHYKRYLRICKTKYVWLGPIARNMICSYNPTFSIATNPTRVPERLFPGRCDLWGHSHQVPFRVTNTFLVTIWSISNGIVMLSVRNSTLLIYQYFLTNSSLAKIYWQRDKIPIELLHFFQIPSLSDIPHPGCGWSSGSSEGDRFCSFFLVVTFFLVVSGCSIYVGLSKPQHCPGSGSDGRLPLAPGILLCNLIEANEYSNYSVQLHCLTWKF